MTEFYKSPIILMAMQCWYFLPVSKYIKQNLIPTTYVLESHPNPKLANAEALLLKETELGFCVLYSQHFHQPINT